MTNSAMIQIANTNDGFDAFMSSGLFRGFLMIGKREIATREDGCSTCFNSSCYPTGRIRDYRNNSSVVVLSSTFLAAHIDSVNMGRGESHSQHIRISSKKSLSVSRPSRNT
jgi:hypothetical protein